MQDVLSNDKKRELLKEFMTREFAIEKLNAITQIEVYQRTPADIIQVEAESITATYVREGAPQEVNISSGLRAQLLSGVENLKQKKVERINVGEAREIFKPLADTLRNIIETDTVSGVLGYVRLTMVLISGRGS